MDRRQFTLGLGGALVAAVARPALPRARAAAPAPLSTASSAGGGLPGRLFTLGVASGDPRPDSVLLWTRLAPQPLEFGGGLAPDRTVPVRWQLAADDGFRTIVRQGTATAAGDTAHSVHVEVGGLEPGRWYWYRFGTPNGEESPAGRTRTAPAAGAAPRRLRFAFASCQDYEHGYYTAYRHLAGEDLDLLVHLGDYIYELGTDVYVAPGGNVRHHLGGETKTLDDYRRRLAQYKTDPDLQAAHAAFPAVVTPDDHEVKNNYAGDVSPDGTPPAAFRARRAAAYRAYWEHMPLRPYQRPGASGAGPAAMRLHRRLDFGRLARFHVLDTRQYRSDQPCGDRSPGDCPARQEAGRTMLGADQETWLLAGLASSPARWNVVAQQVFMTALEFQRGPRRGYYLDGWDGAAAARRRLLGHVRTNKVPNFVVLTGDFHSNWVGDLKADFGDPASPVVGTELVGTSISSGGDGADDTAFGRRVLAANPHLKFTNSQRGYVRCEVTPDRLRADFRVVPYVSRRGAPISTKATFAIWNGQAGAVRM